ncbi:3-(cis-5,6-dihydroxycyclohexa-1,3-dien-1-yl)propanoate dehydrogenase [Paraburkholderia aromaticivorans]|uniref:3-(Cis-5,6-dihydroxycyclohexa-1, 3-dien-1-yl)propanoate dehydrogenase n=1 Tax=Paraburkholderia aromaticivorans TaxID=2026199 RepID=A0A248W0A5_9BURK|nr:3-(cis-5,6-dihydroxycyclohexa-1,3-dien-1-yl)propanoate dehydrogenase [Paraburkholderia aromaticivorans]ASW04050.1 3-(cis-5,6-dihydroxycyclohexa-1,3-dien-1-yl)propanoate dehydrogenase [Paraburkholderia aromaticivorans]
MSTQQVVAITGASSGIGLELVRSFKAAGYCVSALVRNEGQEAGLRREFKDTLQIVVGDVREHAVNEKLVKQTVDKFGHLDCFIANAGIWDYMLSIEEPWEKFAGSFDELFNINVKSYFSGISAALPELKKTNGSVVVTASVSSFAVGGGGSGYIASKHAVLGMVKALAYELAPHIRVNGVAPGGTVTSLSGSASAGFDKTQMKDMPGIDEMIKGLTPLGFAAKPEDVVAPFLLLASREQGKFITGTVISIDGGMALGRK